MAVAYAGTVLVILHDQKNRRRNLTPLLGKLDAS